MKINATINSSDYVNCMKFASYGTYRPLIMLGFLFGIGIVLVNIYFNDDDGKIMMKCVAWLALFFIYNTARKKLWLHGYSKLAECNNQGPCTYELTDSSIVFNGSQYKCEIPYGSVRDIKESNGTYYLQFGNYSGFVVPKIADAGNITEFIQQIRNKIKSARLQGPSATLSDC